MRLMFRAAVVFGIATIAISLAPNGAQAFRMIQNNSVGRFTFGSAVSCTDANGFAHWTVPATSWSLNPASQGGKPGVPAALQRAMSSWSQVAGGGHSLSYAGTRTNGFVTDGVNVISWGTGNGCSGGCLAITALVLAAGQVIVESDVSFNDAATWNTDGSDNDVEGVAAHELGHALGIHHTDKTGGSPRRKPTMYANYTGTGMRSLESDDQQALQCSMSRYPVAAAQLVAAAGQTTMESLASGSGDLALWSRPRPGGALIRFRLPADGNIKVQLFDVAGRVINTIVSGERAAGEHEVAWDGSSRFGRAPSGIYYARLSTDRGQVHAAVILAE